MVKYENVCLLLCQFLCLRVSDLELLPGRILMIGMSQYLWYVSTAETDPPDFSQQY